MNIRTLKGIAVLAMVYLFVMLISLTILGCAEDDESSDDERKEDDNGEDGDTPEDGDTASDEDDKLEAVGDGSLADEFPESTGNDTVDRMLAAASECGMQTPDTVPTGWQMVLAGEKGCALYTPAGWQAIGAGSPITAVQEDAEGMTGFIVMGGTPDFQARIPCTPSGVAEYLNAGMEQTGCTDVKSLYFDEYMEELVGIQIPAADYFYSCSTNGKLKVGYVWITIQGTSPLCNILAMGLWMPEEDIEQKVCTLTQIFQSVRCPQPGGSGCSDSDCNAQCRDQGYEGGSCDAEDNCICQ